MTKINDKKKADVNSIIGKQNEKLLEEINEAIEKLKHPSSGVCWRYGLTQEQIDKVERSDEEGGGLRARAQARCARRAPAGSRDSGACGFTVWL